MAAIVLAILGAIALDGFVFFLKAVAPKASKINLISGFARIFDLKLWLSLLNRS